MIKTLEIKKLLNDTRKIIAHQKDKEILKGEKFNIFSILGMESKENKTHSAFLCELLNPDGSHLKGNIFLKLWLQTIGDNTGINAIDWESAKVEIEKCIGPVDIIAKTGGRIDIFIKDKSGNCITIENKINAGDQKVQIERYCNQVCSTN